MLTQKLELSSGFHNNPNNLNLISLDTAKNWQNESTNLYLPSYQHQLREMNVYTWLNKGKKKTIYFLGKARKNTLKKSNGRKTGAKPIEKSVVKTIKLMEETNKNVKIAILVKNKKV